MIVMKLHFVAVASVWLWASTASAQAALDAKNPALKLGSVFSGHMVLQRDKPVSVWGWAEPNARIVVEFGGQKKTATADTVGKWLVKLDPMPASAKPRALRVGNAQSPASSLILADVLVGEVWLASGQSNMFFEMAPGGSRYGGLADWQREVAAADLPLLRLNCDGHPQCGGVWKVCSPESVRYFSAVAYYFGREIQRARAVPVGLILRSRGGTAVQAWTPLEAARCVPITKKYHDLATQERDRISDYNRAENEFMEKSKAYAADPKLPKPQRAPVLPPDLMAARAFSSVGVLYESTITHVIPYTIRGFIWYQGESNCTTLDVAKAYDAMLEALITSWRKGWGDETLPFLFVQLPGFKDGFAWPELREAQARCAERVPHTGMAVTIDLGEASNIHPRNKEPVGIRLALKARALVYGESIEHSGPVFESQEIRGDSIVIKFTHASAGLESRGGEVKGFEIAGANGRYFPARGKINGPAVMLAAADVIVPTAVRYAWASFPDASLFNKQSLPAAPFHAEDCKLGH